MRFFGLMAMAMFLSGLAFCFMPEIAAMADTGPAAAAEGAGYGDLASFLVALRGLPGLSALGVAALVVQGGLLLAKSKFDPLPGGTKLIVVTALTTAAGIFGLKTTGMDWPSALLHSSTLAALSVFANQVIQQFQKPVDDKTVATVNLPKQ